MSSGGSETTEKGVGKWEGVGLGHLIILGFNLWGFPFGYYPKESSRQPQAGSSLVTSKR